MLVRLRRSRRRRRRLRSARPARRAQEEPRFDGLGFHTWTRHTYTLISLAYTSRVAPLKLSAHG